MTMTKKELQIIEYHLSDKEKQILEALKNAKVLFSYQIRRLFFDEVTSIANATRYTNRTMQKLKNYGLVDVLMNRRIGGVRKGSVANIWYLTENGHRILNLGKKEPDEKPKRTRYLEPADSTLKHKMAIAECYVQLMELEQRGLLKVKEASFEPSNWRYFDYDNQSEVLKPDLTVVTAQQGYECRYMIELDLSTESMDVITKKCLRYHKYLQTGEEQALYNIFPLVLFIVKDEARKTKMEDTIRTKFDGYPKIFLVITADEFASIMTTTSFSSDKLC